MRTNNGQILYIPKIGQRANLQHPLMKGCVAWWPLTDGAGGIAKDITSNANDGTGQGGVNWDSSSIGTVFASDKSTDSYFVSNYSASGQSAISLSFWFIYNFDGDSPTGWNGLFRNGDSSNSLLQVYHHNTDHELRFGVATAGGGTGFNTAESGSWTTGAVYHAVFTYDGTTGKVYLNGSEQSSGTHSFPGNIKTVASQPFNIGAAVIPPQSLPAGSTTLDGDIQNVRIYNRALSATEVLELYTNPWAGLSIPSATRYFFVPQLITASPKLFSVSGSSVSMRSNVGRVSVRAAR